MEKLATHGGEPVRKAPFPTAYLGVSFYGAEELKEVTDVINEKSPFRHYGIGHPCKVTAFEAEARAYFGRKFALAVSSGTGALFCAMAAIGVGPGDEVIIPSFSWFSNFFAITNFGAVPVFADVDETLNLDPEDFKVKITARTKAVIAVDFQGCPANLADIIRVASERGINVIDDFAQAIGGTWDGEKLGSIGDISVASFQQNKILSSGEGGLLLTDNEEYFARAVRYHDLGMIRDEFKDQLVDQQIADPANDFFGSQFRMCELQGAVLLAQLRKLDGIIEICRKNHRKLRAAFENNRHFKIRYVPGECGNTLFMLFSTKAEADQFGECLATEGIPLGATSACKNLLAVYPIKTKKAPHGSLPPFGAGCEGEHIVYDTETCCPQTNRIVERYVAIAIGPQFADGDIDDLIRAIEKVDYWLYNA
ncbi:MAG: DegT/DnrJ/EryC1/StrS family aminotransferase [Oscillospiraceae bacterium]|nr:DegT/DnrJ/EryC1/StrS family aminotransferase [Oscillospiraceae bacterium]